MTVEQILREVAAMPATTRAFIAEKILEMLDAEAQIELSPEWLDTIKQRVAEIDNNEVQMIKAEDALNSIWTELD